MTYNRVFKVFIGSPGGLELERKVFRETIEQFNRENAGRGLEFQAVGWELIESGTGGAQGELTGRSKNVTSFFWSYGTGGGHGAQEPRHQTMLEFRVGVQAGSQVLRERPPSRCARWWCFSRPWQGNENGMPVLS